MPNQHVALLLPAAGAAFEIGKRDTPTPAPGQVLIRNRAVALNPVDLWIQRLGFLVSAYGFPAVAGADGAGDIAAVGDGVTGWKVGDRVLYQTTYEPNRGTFQELAIADAVRIAKIPNTISYEEAATLPLALATAAIGAYKPRLSTVLPDGHDIGGAGLTPPWEEGGRGKYSGQVAVVFGGASSVGQFVLQLAKLSGFTYIITTASKRNEEHCRKAGATHIIDYRETSYNELPTVIKGIVGNVPVLYIYDAVSNAESQKAGWDVLSPGGALVVVLPPSSAIGTPGKDDEYGRRTVRVAGVANASHHAEFGKELYAALTGMLENGDIKPNKIEVIGHGLEAIPNGLERLKNGVSAVKLVATLD